MATVESIAKAEAVGYAINQAFGVTPSYDYQQNRVRIYFDSVNLPVMRKKVEEMVSPQPGAREGDVIVDFVPAVYPTVIKKTLPIAAGLLLAGYLIGKL